MIANHYLDGANYPVGGSRMIAENIVPVIEENGGEIFVSTGVDKINIKNNRVQGVILENGDSIDSDIVISSAGVDNTIKKFIRDDNGAMSLISFTIKDKDLNFTRPCIVGRSLT